MARLINASVLNFAGRKYSKSEMKAIIDFIDLQQTVCDTQKDEWREEYEWLKKQKEMFDPFNFNMVCARKEAYRKAVRDFACCILKNLDENVVIEKDVRDYIEKQIRHTAINLLK